jgi:DNA-binding LytR/AlgR family response regulator
VTRLSTEHALRCRRFWIVSVDRIAEIRGGAGGALEILLECGLTVPIGRRHRAGVVSRVGRQ